MKPFLVREATAEDAAGVRRLFARVFEKEMPEEEWEWKFARNPDGWFGVVAEADGRVVGNYAGWGVRVLLDGTPRLTYAVGDVATDPDLRVAGGLRGIYRSMVELFYDRVAARGVPFCFGFPNARALEISNRIAHTRTVFPVEELRIRCDVLPEPPRDIVTGDSVGEEYDALWDAAALGPRDGVVRDRRRVNWRFHARPTRYYRMVAVRAGGALESWAALSVLGDAAVVADWVARAGREGELPRLLAAAGAEARRLGAGDLILWDSPESPMRKVFEGLPVAARAAGFALAARSLESDAAQRFFARAALPPSLYDVT